MRRCVVLVPLLCIFITIARPAHAQTVTDTRVWTGATFQGRLADKSPWRWSGDSQIRTREGLGALDQVIERISLGRDVSRHTSLWGGYVVTFTFPVTGPVSTEHRVFEQVSWAAGPAARAVSLRTRVEQRFVEGNSGMALRLREQARVSHVLRPGGPTSVIVYDEVFYTANTTARYARSVDQNRIFAGIGQALGGPARLEAGYLYQYLHTSVTARRRSNVLSAILALSF